MLEANLKLARDLAPFMKLGTCSHPKNEYGWDVLFDFEYDGHKETGHAECKLWSEPIGLNSIDAYYRKACEKQSKFSIIVVKSIQECLKIAVPTVKPGREAKREAAEEICKNGNENLGKIENAWELNDENGINIYAIAFEKSIGENGIQIGKFTVFPLKEFENPTGVFIIVESSFNPLERSKRT